MKNVRWEIWGYSPRTARFVRWTNKARGLSPEEAVQERATTYPGRYRPGVVVMVRRYHEAAQPPYAFTVLTIGELSKVTVEKGLLGEPTQPGTPGLG